MAADLNDGTLPYGSKVLTINSVAYVARNIKPKAPSKTLEQRNELGEPSGQVTVSDFVTGSATLQLASTSTAYPTNGLTFTADLFKAGSNQNYYVSDVSPGYEQEGITVIDIEFRKKIN